MAGGWQQPTTFSGSAKRETGGSEAYRNYHHYPRDYHHHPQDDNDNDDVDIISRDVHDALERLVRGSSNLGTTTAHDVAEKLDLITSIATSQMGNNNNNNSSSRASRHHHHRSSSGGVEAVAASSSSSSSSQREATALRRLQRLLHHQQQHHQHQQDAGAGGGGLAGAVDANDVLALYDRMRRNVVDALGGGGGGNDNALAEQDALTTEIPIRILEVMTALAASGGGGSRHAAGVAHDGGIPAVSSARTTRPPPPLASSQRNNADRFMKDTGASSSNVIHDPAALDEEIYQTFVDSLAAEEDAVFRECLFALQGVDGERIKFVWNNNNNNQASQAGSNQEGVRLRSAALSAHVVPPDLLCQSRLGNASSAADALAMCAEAGWLYVRVQVYIRQVRLQESGAVARALAEALATEMESYEQWLANKEQQTKERGTSLRSLLVALHLPLRRLKILAMITDGIAGFTGGRLLGALHWHVASHGDDRRHHGPILHTLLAAASRPWFDQLYNWTTRGVLSDPAGEFFVQLKEDASSQSSSSGSQRNQIDGDIWNNRYSIDSSQVPTGILDEDLVEVAFKVGKGIDYIRCSLEDGEWSLADLADKAMACYVYTPRSPAERRRVPEKLSLRSTLIEAADRVNSHIIKSLHQEHNLIHHLHALKQFFLLGQGDFFSDVMEGIHAEFVEGERGDTNRGDVSSGVIYLYSLDAIKDSAMRSSNAIHFPLFVQDRLRVTVREHGHVQESALVLDLEAFTKNEIDAADNHAAWNSFLLDYTVPEPLVAIIGVSAIDDYKRMFTSLFGLKKVEFQLDCTWRQSGILQRHMQTTAQNVGVNATMSPACAQAMMLLRRIAHTRQSMTHFVINLKSYLMLEVLEGGWKKLLRSVEEAQSLDELITAHDDYLSSICRKSLASAGGIAGSLGNAVLGEHVSRLLSLCGVFCRYQELLFREALPAAERAAERRRHAEERVKDGTWGFNDSELAAEQETYFGLSDPVKSKDVEMIADAFTREVRELLQALDRKLHGGPAMSAGDVRISNTPLSASDRHVQDEDDHESLRFLAFQLDYSYYNVKRNS